MKNWTISRIMPYTVRMMPWGYADVEPAQEEFEQGVESGQPLGVFDAEEGVVVGGLFKGKGGVFVDHEIAQ